jgi:hypothetical protein
LWLTPPVSIAAKAWDRTWAGTPSTWCTCTFELEWPMPSARTIATIWFGSYRFRLRHGFTLDDEPPRSKRELWPANRCGLAVQAERSPEGDAAGSTSNRGSPRPNVRGHPAASCVPCFALSKLLEDQLAILSSNEGHGRRRLSRGQRNPLAFSSTIFPETPLLEII